MAKKAIPAEEQLVQQLFPTKGIDVAHLQEEQPPGTTPIGDNVRAYEMLTKRGRGGQRPGISKYLNMQVSGFHEIQLLDTITITDGSALGANFDTIALGDIGQLLFDLKYVDIVGGVGTYITYFDNTVGYGFQGSKGQRTLKLSLHRDGDQYYLTATLKDANNATVAGEDIELFTNPPGRIGDQVHATTTTDIISPPNGDAYFAIADLDNETVSYRAKATSDGVMSNVVTVTWDVHKPSPPIPDVDTSPIPCLGLSITIRTTLEQHTLLSVLIPEHTTSGSIAQIYPASPTGSEVPSGAGGIIPGEGLIPDGSWTITAAGHLTTNFGTDVGVFSPITGCTVTPGSAPELFGGGGSTVLGSTVVVLSVYYTITFA